MKKLTANNITVSYDGIKIIEDISIELNKYEIVCLLGISGGGKTTLFNVISGLLVPDTGNVILDGENITGQAGKTSYMLQKDLLLPFKTIIDNVSLPLLIKVSLSISLVFPLRLLNGTPKGEISLKYKSSSLAAANLFSVP